MSSTIIDLDLDYDSDMTDPFVEPPEIPSRDEAIRITPAFWGPDQWKKSRAAQARAQKRRKKMRQDLGPILKDGGLRRENGEICGSLRERKKDIFYGNGSRKEPLPSRTEAREMAKDRATRKRQRRMQGVLGSKTAQPFAAETRASNQPERTSRLDVDDEPMPDAAEVGALIDQEPTPTSNAEDEPMPDAPKLSAQASKVPTKNQNTKGNRRKGKQRKRKPKSMPADQEQMLNDVPLESHRTLHQEGTLASGLDEEPIQPEKDPLTSSRGQKRSRSDVDDESVPLIEYPGGSNPNKRLRFSTDDDEWQPSNTSPPTTSPPIISPIPSQPTPSNRRIRVPRRLKKLNSYGYEGDKSSSSRRNQFSTTPWDQEPRRALSHPEVFRSDLLDLQRTHITPRFGTQVPPT
ncbi:hypothetical protein BT63DRAFT_409533 [Microthyrium microscopicum]|uniref:Uncharacterized protein n=1 Tax=Microthyrium microscopicum TaxID=703497 RepID=A0A6A6USY6_9PEZI|nr:hypothetical protein BT63DRAFT_409533 [Microthyrium microscopicum]